MATPGNIFCGIAGWSYPDWKGYVYPATGLKEPLRYLMPYVDMIEINSTFYSPPAARNAAHWAQCAAEFPGFFFSAKLHQEVTHQGVIRPERVEEFQRGLDPLAQAGRLRHLLAQFRYDFRDTPGTRTHLQQIRAQFGGLAGLVLELRHSSWQAPDAMAFLAGLGVTVANLDYPLGRDSFAVPLCTIGRHAYLRLHGRNRQAWFSKDAGRDETYNYMYSGDELKALYQRGLDLAVRSETVTIVANNHYQGKELVNALQLKARFAGGPVPVPPVLRQRYPELEEISLQSGSSDNLDRIT